MLEDIFVNIQYGYRLVYGKMSIYAQHYPAMMGNYVIDHPEIIPVLLSGATISVVQTNVNAGEEYHNPFTTKEDVEDTTFDHDTIINYIVGFQFGKTGEKFADILAVKMMGF